MEVNPTEVQSAEVRPDKISRIRILRPPLVPGIHTLFQNGEVLFVGHQLSSEFIEFSACRIISTIESRALILLKSSY